VEHNYIEYPVPGHAGELLTGRAGFQAAIRHHWFAVISFQSADASTWDSWDQLELRTTEATAGYELASTYGGMTFIYRPDYPRGAS
jgi:hypothetical protein